MLYTVNVYSIAVSNYLNSLEGLYSSLSTQERIQSTRFFTIELTQKYIVTRGVLRNILAKYLGTDPEKIEFIRNSYGKPFVKGVSIEFNISHSRDCAYYAIALDFSLGIDVEFYNKEKNIFNIAKNVFSHDEMELFFTLENYKRQEFFFNTWAKKEAVIKAMGIGLSFPMEKVDTVLQEKIGYIALSGDKYYLHKLNSNKNYKAYLATKNTPHVVVNEKLVSM